MRLALARFGEAEEASDQPRDRAAPLDYCGRRRRAGRRASGERRSAQAAASEDTVLLR